jgi:hypothetical protein
MISVCRAFSPEISLIIADVISLGRRDISCAIIEEINPITMNPIIPNFDNPNLLLKNFI